MFLFTQNVKSGTETEIVLGLTQIFLSESHKTILGFRMNLLRISIKAPKVSFGAYISRNKIQGSRTNNQKISLENSGDTFLLVTGFA